MRVRAHLRIALWGGASLSNVGDHVLFDGVQDGLAQRLPGAEFALLPMGRRRQPDTAALGQPGWPVAGGARSTRS